MKEYSKWKESISNTPQREKIYRLNNWYIGWEEKTQTGYIGKYGRVTIVTRLDKSEGKLPKSRRIPNYVVEKANQIMKHS